MMMMMISLSSLAYPTGVVMLCGYKYKSSTSTARVAAAALGVLSSILHEWTIGYMLRN